MSRLISAFIYYVIAIPISHLPFGILYFISGNVYFLLYHVVGYRKNVVRKNIQNSFPELSEKVRRHIERDFYRHFADFLVESVKSISISDKKIRKRCAIINPEIIEAYYKQGKDVLVICGHYNNWEYYAVGIAQQMKQETIAAYQPLKNTFFNRKILKLRQRFGLRLLNMREFPRFFEQKKENNPTLSIVINDQSPRNPRAAHWNSFLNQDTGWVKGAEKIARKYNQVVVFGAIHKKKRGYYEVRFSPITEHPQEEKDGYILDKHAEHLEKIIKDRPQYWLWSHRRWKHESPQNKQQKQP